MIRLSRLSDYGIVLMAHLAGMRGEGPHAAREVAASAGLPLPVASKLMKFDEVTTQFVLTKHVIAYDVMSIRSKIWDAMKPEQRARFQAAADKAMDENTARFEKQEAETLEYFRKEGKKVYEPDQAAFRAYAQKRYVEKYGNDWPKGALERINAIQ